MNRPIRYIILLPIQYINSCIHQGDFDRKFQFVSVLLVERAVERLCGFGVYANLTFPKHLNDKAAYSRFKFKLTFLFSTKLFCRQNVKMLSLFKWIYVFAFLDYYGIYNNSIDTYKYCILNFL